MELNALTFKKKKSTPILNKVTVSKQTDLIVFSFQTTFGAF